MERFIWKAGVRFDSLPIQIGAGATDGQITWAFINSLVDYEEEKEKVHIQCLDEWQTERCPVCNKAIGHGVVDPKVAKEFEDQIYRPGEDLAELTESTTEQEHRADLIKFLKEHREQMQIASGFPIGEDKDEEING